MSYDKFAYVPKVLLATTPELRAPLRGGSGVRGELLAWPFQNGGLVLAAVRGPLADGLYPLRLEGPGAPEFPGLLFHSGFSFGLTLLPWTMERLYGRRIRLGNGLAEGRFAFN